MDKPGSLSVQKSITIEFNSVEEQWLSFHEDYSHSEQLFPIQYVPTSLKKENKL